MDNHPKEVHHSCQCRRRAHFINQSATPKAGAHSSTRSDSVISGPVGPKVLFADYAFRALAFAPASKYGR
jgi:hypothetical protein